MNEPMRSRLFSGGLKFAVALLMVVGLFLLGIVLTPPIPAAQLVFVQPVDAQAPQPYASNQVNGTLASFTALIPDTLFIYIPTVSR